MKQSVDDTLLLQAFETRRDEAAFRSLVSRYLGLVHGVALRRTGDPELAEEIAQNVFTVLARKAHRLQGATIGGWLYRTTMIECAEALRRRQAHTRKMKAFSDHAATAANGQSVWKDAMPLLDEAIDALPAADRGVIVQRFFERKSFREIAAAAGKSEDAAQKQTERALEKLSRILQRKGVAIPVLALASGLATQLAHGASAAMVQAVSHQALAGASAWSAKLLIVKAIQAMNTKTKIAAALAVALVIPVATQWSENAELRSEVAQLKDQLASALKDKNASPRVASVPAVARPRVSRADVPAVPATPSDETGLNSTHGVAAWQQALYEPDPVKRAQRIAQLLAELTSADAPAIAEVFAQAKAVRSGFGEEERLFLRAWGKLDGAAAVTYSLNRAGGIENTPEVLASLAGWSSTNPNAARAWIDSLPDGGKKEDIIFGLLDGWSMVDFRGASAYAESRPRSQARDSFRQLLLQRSLATGGIPAMQEWFNQISNNDHNSLYKQRAFDEVIRTMLYRDPSTAAHWIAQLGSQPFVSSEGIRLTAAKLSESSPSQAMHWLQSLNGLNQDQLKAGLVRVMDSWVAQDSQSAGNWLTQNRHHPAYDAMAARFARGISATDANIAQAWYESIVDERLRNEGLASLQGGLGGATGEGGFGSSGEAFVNIEESVAGALATETQYGFTFADAARQTSENEFRARNPHGNQYSNNSCTKCHGNGKTRDYIDLAYDFFGGVEVQSATMLKRVQILSDIPVLGDLFIHEVPAEP